MLHLLFVHVGSTVLLLLIQQNNSVCKYICLCSADLLRTEVNPKTCVLSVGLCMQVNTYTFSVANPANSSMLTINSPVSVTVFPAVSAADISRITVSMPAPAVGGIASCSLQVYEASGTPRVTANGTALMIQGAHRESAIAHISLLRKDSACARINLRADCSCSSSLASTLQIWCVCPQHWIWTHSVTIALRRERQWSGQHNS